MPSIYKTEFTAQESETLEQIQLKLAENFGVTVAGNRCTVRWNDKNNDLLHVHMIIEEIGTPIEANEHKEQLKRMDKLFKKYPHLEDELHYPHDLCLIVQI